jgi:hypothetical protein
VSCGFRVTGNRLEFACRFLLFPVVPRWIRHGCGTPTTSSGWRDNRHMNHAAADSRMVIQARARRAPGRVVRIDLENERCAYGRQLTGVTVEFYDRIEEPAESLDLIELVASPIIFRIWVMDSAFRRRDGWELLDVVSLTEEERAEVHRFAKQDLISGSCSIYRVDPATGARSETPATVEECQGIEPAAVWSREHVEDRLRDHFDGRPNKWLESIAFKP